MNCASLVAQRKIHIHKNLNLKFRKSLSTVIWYSSIQSVPALDVHSENTCSWVHFGPKSSDKRTSCSKPFQSYMQQKKHIFFWQFIMRTLVGYRISLADVWVPENNDWVLSYVLERGMCRSYISDDNGRAVVEGYSRWFPVRRVPNRRVFSNVYQSIRQSGAVPQRKCEK